MGIGAGVEGSDDTTSEVVVVRELRQVLVAEIGGAVQFLLGNEAEDLVLLAPASGIDAGCCVVIGWLGSHELMVVVCAGDSLSINWSGE
jgi:hypothetical protein